MSECPEMNRPDCPLNAVVRDINGRLAAISAEITGTASVPGMREVLRDFHEAVQEFRAVRKIVIGNGEAGLVHKQKGLEEELVRVWREVRRRSMIARINWAIFSLLLGVTGAVLQAKFGG